MISWRSIGGYALMIISIPVIWLLIVRMAHLPPAVLPSPSQVWTVLIEEHSDLLQQTGTTLGEACLGYFLANVLAIGVALLYLYASWSEAFITPWIIMVKNVPYVTVAGILIIAFGDTLTPKVIIIVMVCFFPLLSNLVKGLKAADPVLLDRMRVLNASRWEVFRKVQWPAALPYYVAAHEISFTNSVVAAIIAEWFLSRNGLGYLIVQSTVEYRADRLYAVTLIASLLALGTYFLCRIWEAWIFRWKRERTV
jgi:ABC-type nitrate/sulfonate/bicarbonate transport system permease component